MIAFFNLFKHRNFDHFIDPDNTFWRRNKMKKIIVAVLMVAVLATVGLAMAQGSEKGPGAERGYGPYSGGARSAGLGLWHELNLTPDQAEKIKALRESFFTEKIPLQNELMAQRLELKALWMQINPGEQKILAKQKQINTLRAQIEEKETKNRLEMRKILTPEQQAKWIYFLSRHQEWGGHHRRAGFRPGPDHRGHHSYRFSS
jgi:Spy/CpxP family protein refolding chaperone